VTANATATVTASWNGASTQGQVTVTPQPSPTSLTLDPTATVGTGGSSFGRVTMASPQPTDTIFQLTSSHPNIAQVPGGVMVPAGVTAGGFNVFMTQVTTQTVVTISASGGGVTKSATLTVNPDAPPPPPPQTATLKVTATGRGGERVTSSPAGISVAVGGTGSAPFSTGISITLTASNGRDAIWSGACSSGGNKTKSCTFTLSGNAAATANVQ